jgi:hypothetical protein
MDDYLSGSNAAWRSIPLCCRYSLVRFERLPVRSGKVDVAPFGTVLWALGVLSDGQYEVLGAWPATEPSKKEWAGVFEDLRGRGVECIGAVVAGKLDLDTAALRKAYPGATCFGVLPAATPVSRAETDLSQRAVAVGSPSRPSGRVSRHQRMVRASDDAVCRLQASAARAMTRHGQFSTFEAALSFANDKLRQAEWKFASLPLASSAQVHRRSRHLLPGIGR